MSNQNSIGSGRSLHKDNTLPSTTKYAYQFAKTRRFPDPNPMYSICHADAPRPFTALIHNYPIEKQASVSEKK